MSERFQILLGHVPERAGAIDTLVRILEARYPVSFRVVQREGYPSDNEELFGADFEDRFFIWCDASHAMMSGSRTDMDSSNAENLAIRIGRIFNDFLEADHWKRGIDHSGPMLNPKAVARFERSLAKDRAEQKGSDKAEQKGSS